jgi:bifunctional oligoribonuclease and PAP phosphatase NrnA
VRPDGDAMGSSLALCHFLKKKKHQVSVIVPGSYADSFKTLAGIETVLVYPKNKEKCNALLDEAEVLFAVDFNEIKRLDALGKKVSKLKLIQVLIDHHPEPDPHFDYQFHDVEAAAAAELVYAFIDLYDPQLLDDPDIASCLYAAIIMDTGSFSFSSTRPETHRIAARLLETGIKHAEIQANMFDDFTLNRMQLWGYSLWQKLHVVPEINLAYLALNKEDLKNFNYKDGDTEGLVNMPLHILGINTSVLIMERNDNIKLSFRSRGSDNAINHIAKNHFKGGGHENAAGGESSDTMEKTIEKLLEIMKNQYMTKTQKD